MEEETCSNDEGVLRTGKVRWYVGTLNVMWRDVKGEERPASVARSPTLLLIRLWLLLQKGRGHG